MFNFTFSFATALFALPLAATPILLHLLFKQKSPVVQFSTLRFIKMSIQQTAARKKVQKWLLLACRALLIALLVWAIAQPKHKPITSWLTGGAEQSLTVAIVIDTSYSMQVQDGQVPLLSKADAMVQELLRDQLAGAKVVIFKSKPADGEHPEQLRDASAILSEWSPLTPQANPKPLVDRVAAAVNFLDRQPGEQKWLVVLSDFQANEFSHPIPQLKNGRTVLLDLHPDLQVLDPRSAGVTKITLNPSQPIPGIPLEADVEVTGLPDGSRPVALEVKDLAANSAETPIVTAKMDSSGRAHVQFALRLPATRWLTLSAHFTDQDKMPWDDRRTLLVEVPPKEQVVVMSQNAGSASSRVLTLALDPNEGKLAEWPLAVSKTVGRDTDVIVSTLTHWPDSAQANALVNFANTGHTVILFLSPGLERSWRNLSTQTQDALGKLLPSPPIQRSGSALCRLAVADARDPLLQGLTDEKYQLSAIVVRQLVPMAASDDSSTILNAAPVDPTPGSRTQGLLYRKPVGKGMCFTCATLPDSQYTNFATHPTFLPLLVRMALKTPDQAEGQNVELGQPLVLDGSNFPHEAELRIESQDHQVSKVPAVQDGDTRQFVFTQANAPGIYQWYTVNDRTPVAVSNVQLPASESDLTYRPADTVAPADPDTIIATNVADMSGKIGNRTAAQPQWSIPLAIVMFLLCLEALMGSWSKMWKSPGLRAFVPGVKGEAA